MGASDGCPYFASLVVLGDADMAALARTMSAALGQEGARGGAAPGPHGGLVGRVLAPSAPVLIGALEAAWGLARAALLGLPALSLRKA